MCDEIPPREKRDERDERDEREAGSGQFYASTSCIVRKSFLRFAKGYPREQFTPSWPKPHGCVYPKANATYAFHEDANPFARFPSECESREYGNVQPHFEPPGEPFDRDPYCETEARRKYLQSTPTCFAVFGKPDLNTAKLATVLADSWNCVLVSPLSLVREEIERGSERGRIMSDILKRGECLGPEILTNLIASRVDRRDAFHRGYIVEGLPLIANETLDYSSYPDRFTGESELENNSENLAKFFDSSLARICTVASSLEEDRDSAPSSDQDIPVSPNSKSRSEACTTKPNYERLISSQIEDIFAAWPIKPSIIIYAMCPNADAVRKRQHLRIDPTTGRTVDTSLAGMDSDVVDRGLFSRGKIENGANVSFELYRELAKGERTLDENQRKYLLRRPSDRKSNVEAQCALYKRFALPAIEKWITLHNPENVIRVDSRTAVSLMFEIVVSRLRTLPVPRVILARRFADHAALEFEGESPAIAVPVDEFEGKSNEEAFRDLANRETVSPLFPWRLSSWNFLCPVELARGRTTEGTPKYAARFMNQIFFLSSTEAVDLFIENPRTFLFPFSPRPTCKIAVFGPKYSGKSELCDKLARMLRGTVINASEVGRTVTDIDSDDSLYPSIRSPLEAKANQIAAAIHAVPKEEIDVEVWRDGGYIVDGMYPNIDCWKIIVQDSEIVFEDAIVLFEEDPYDCLLSKWQSIHDATSGEEFEGGCEEYFEDGEGEEEEEEEAQGLVKYLRHVQKFQLDWEATKETVTETCRNLILCDISKISDVSKYVVSQIEGRYADKARVMSEEELERERDLAEYIAMSDGTENMEEEEVEGEAEREAADFKEDNRRFGDTNSYCPVALLKHDIFWRGKEEFSGIFADKIYHLSSASALEEFLRDPQKLGLPLRKPLRKIPALRVGIIGPPGSGKSTLADALSREYGLARIDYFDCFATFMKSRGMPRLSPRDVLISPEDLADEVELPEDLKDERYNSDAATIQTFVRRYWSFGGTLPERMRRECLLEFFKGLYGETGVVLDQFPSCSQDVEAALKTYAVPEIILQLGCGQETAVERSMPELLSSWQRKSDEEKRIERSRYTAELKEYTARRDAWIEKTLNETRKRRYTKEEGEYENYGESNGLSEEYLPDDDAESEETELRRFELEEAWYEENPEPVPKTDWEDFETAKRRIEQEFRNKFESDSRKVDAVRSVLENESISYVAVDAEGNARNVLLRVMRILDPYVRRDVSVLERTYTVDPETADALLNCGYYLASSFGRWCPVQLRRNEVPLQMFLPLEARQEIHPVVHRQFVYFCGGRDAQAAFSKDPLKYLQQDSCAPLVPLRLSIIGPPKCGKTTLAQRFAEKYGAKVVTRGAALRRVAKYFPWTESAHVAESRLRSGHAAPEECVCRAVEMCTIDPSSTCQGFVLDGFPFGRKEYEQLAYLGLQPMIVLDLKANLPFCLDCSSRGADSANKPPNFSKDFLANRYAAWDVDQASFRSWLEAYTRNVVELDATKCKWHVWTRADREVRSRYALIRSYLRESDYDKVHSLKYMSVSPYEFKRRQSHFESYCPVCLHRDGSLKAAEFSPRHGGTVQFREHFYWICLRHANEFAQNPRNYLPPKNTARLPKHRPRILTEPIDLEHSCWAKRLQVAGFCLVTYVRNLPSRKLVPGKSTAGIFYKDKVYLFCTEECRDEFLLHPDKYASVDAKFLRALPSLNVHDLPNLGFLEQTVAKLIIEAVNQISVARPKLPGLSPSVTAAIYIGVYLKARNASCTLMDTEPYNTIDRRIQGLERIVDVATRTMKKKLNPFVRVPVYKNQAQPPCRLSGKLSMLSRIFTRPSPSIVFRRTSPTQILVDPFDESHAAQPNSRRVPVPDARFDYLCDYFKPASKVPAFLNVVDIAGLVKGAADGQGLGNNFLSHINACDGIFHLCRAFEDDDVTHVEGDVNPVRDLEIISEELRLKDIEFLNGHLEKLEKLVVRGNDKKLKPEYDTLLKVKGVMVDEKRHIRFADWSATDIEVLNKYLFITSKPVIYLVNLSVKDYIRKKNKWLIKIKEWVDKNDPGAVLIPFSGVFENKVFDMDDTERATYCEENKVSSALDKIIVQGYKALQLQYFFTAGHDEVKAWTIQKGTKAPQAAGKIHTDFEKGFIMAEVMKFDDFKNEGSEAAVKAAGKYRQQGRNYVVEDGDIIFFKFNAGAGLKDAKKK